MKKNAESPQTPDPQSSLSSLTVHPRQDADFIRSELNLERWPGIWNPASTQREFHQIRTLEKQIQLPSGDTILAKVSVNPDIRYGLLTTEDQKTLYALFSIWEKNGRPQKIKFTIRGLLKELDRQYGRNSREGVIESLKRLKGINITWENSFFDKKNNTTVKQLEMFNILSHLSVVTRENKQTEEDTIAVSFDELIDSNLRHFHSIPTRYKTLIGIKNGLAQLIYKYVEPKLYLVAQFERKTKALFRDLGINATRYAKLSNRVEAIQKAITELQGLDIQNGVLQMILEETQDDDYKLIARITGVTKAEDRPAQDLSFLESINDSFHFTDPESLPLPPVQPVETEAPASAEALLVILFELFSKTFQINRKKPSRKEIQLAREWIGQYQFSSVQIEEFITFAFREATKTNYKIQNLAGLEQYIEPFWTQSTHENFPPQFFTEPSGSINTDQPREALPLFPEIPDGKEQAFQYLIGLSATEQEYWCQAVRRLLSQKDPQTLKQITQFNRETQNETLLANAAKYFTDAILSITHSSQ